LLRDQQLADTLGGRFDLAVVIDSCQLHGAASLFRQDRALTPDHLEEADGIREAFGFGQPMGSDIEGVFTFVMRQGGECDESPDFRRRDGVESHGVGIGMSQILQKRIRVVEMESLRVGWGSDRDFLPIPRGASTLFKDLSCHSRRFGAKTGGVLKSLPYPSRVKAIHENRRLGPITALPLDHSSAKDCVEDELIHQVLLRLSRPNRVGEAENSHRRPRRCCSPSQCNLHSTDEPHSFGSER